MDRFQTVANILTQQSNLGCGFIALLTAGGEKIFSTAVFRCPCSTWNFTYGLVFLVVPALALFVLGYLLNQKTWRLMTGICLQKSKLCQCRKLLARVIVFCQVTTKAVVAPFTWMAVALLNGSYFECAMTGVNVTMFQKHICGETTFPLLCREQLHTFPCGGKSSEDKADVNRVLANIRAESQIIGWVLIASIILCILTLTCLARCHSPISFHHLRFWQTYRDQENNLLDAYSAKHAKDLAERNLKSFFQKKPPEAMVTPSSKDWQNISSFYRFSPTDHTYSPMHKYVENLHVEDRSGGGRPSVRSLGPSVDTPIALSFVDEGGMGL